MTITHGIWRNVGHKLERNRPGGAPLKMGERSDPIGIEIRWHVENHLRPPWLLSPAGSYILHDMVVNLPLMSPIFNLVRMRDGDPLQF